MVAFKLILGSLKDTSSWSQNIKSPMTLCAYFFPTYGNNIKSSSTVHNNLTHLQTCSTSYVDVYDSCNHSKPDRKSQELVLIFIQREKEDQTQSYDKNLYINRKFENQRTTQKRHTKIRLHNDCGPI